MDVFEYAKKMEKDGEEFYRELAENNKSNKGMQNIMNLLADEEVKHYEIVEKMQTRSVEMPESKILDDTKNVFIKMKENNETLDFDESQTDLYRQAQKIEKESEEFYRKMEKETENNLHKEIFAKLAEEEKKHFFILDNIIEFVSRPQTWLEDAEWNHLEKY